MTLFFLKYVDFRIGEESGYVRFEDPESATKARAAAVLVEGGFIVKDHVATLEALTGIICYANLIYSF